MTPPAKPIGRAIDALRFDAIEEMADLAASYWRSVAEAAFRREMVVVNLHCKQLALVTREAFQIAKSLGAPADQAASP